MFEAVLVALADHGFTPTAIAARVTLLSAPESIQGALAAGLLGGGSRFLGVTEDTAGYLDDVVTALDELPTDDAGWDAVAADAVAATKAAGRFVPGLGHPVHKQGDPRTPVLFQLARDNDCFGPHLELFAAIGRAHPTRRLGRTLPLNGAGCAAPCSPTSTCRAERHPRHRPARPLRRTARAHLAEEVADPIANDIYMSVDRNTDYQPPDGTVPGRRGRSGPPGRGSRSRRCRRRRPRTTASTPDAASQSCAVAGHRPLIERIDRGVSGSRRGCRTAAARGRGGRGGRGRCRSGRSPCRRRRRRPSRRRRGR